VKFEEAKYLFNKGTEHLVKKEFKEAIFNLEKSLEIVPKRPSTIKNLVIAYIAIGNFKKAQKFDNNNIDFLKSLAYAEFKVGNLVSSIDVYTKVMELYPKDVESCLDFSFIYYESGDIKKAISIINEGIAETPGESLFYYRLVVYLLDDGKYKEAINVLESALSINFKNHDVLFDFIPKFETQSALIRVINQFKKNNQL